MAIGIMIAGVGIDLTQGWIVGVSLLSTASWLEGLVRDPPDMPELQHHPAAGSMHRSGHAFPSLDLLGAVDARRGNIALTLRHDLAGFGDDQACARTLRVIERAEAGRNVARAGPTPCAMTMRFGSSRGPISM